MARSRRSKSGTTDWFGHTGTQSINSQKQFTSDIICYVPGPVPTAPGTDLTELPEGTLLRTFGAIAVQDEGDEGSWFSHAFAALHHEEAILDEAGTLTSTELNVADQENLGFEGLFWLDSCITWRSTYSTGLNPTTKTGCQMKVDSKAKRKLLSNDVIKLDLANLVPTVSKTPLNFTYHFRFLIKLA